MLIICSGPDTWHARKKARELQLAFKQKHDPQELSTTVSQDVDLKELLNQLSAPSLFSPRRFIRCEGLLDSLKIADIRTLAKRLKADADQTILVSIEEESPAEKILGEFKEVQLFHYAHPLFSPGAFEKWCVARAQELGVPAADGKEIARRVNGDSWFAEQELAKRSAYLQAPLAGSEVDPGSAFDVAERALTDRKGWRHDVADLEDDQFAVILQSQARSALRVRDHETSGLHPFVVKKLSYLKIQNLDQKFLSSVRTIVATRQALGDPTESQNLL